MVLRQTGNTNKPQGVIRERMKQKQQRLEKIGLGVGARTSLEERKKEGREKRKEKIKEEEQELKKQKSNAENQWEQNIIQQVVSRDEQQSSQSTKTATSK